MAGSCWRSKEDFAYTMKYWKPQPLLISGEHINTVIKRRTFLYVSYEGMLVKESEYGETCLKRNLGNNGKLSLAETFTVPRIQVPVLSGTPPCPLEQKEISVPCLSVVGTFDCTVC